VDRQSKNGKDNLKFTNQNALSKSLDFSFSGIKTAVVNYVHKLKQSGKQVPVADICASFQRVVTDELADKTLLACQRFNINKLVVAGGVAANSKLKEKLIKECKERDIELYMPNLALCTDNAAMIGSAAYFMIKDGEGLSDLSLTAKATVDL
jgi:N6-L-threonylcarbamoyladenine synthase